MTRSQAGFTLLELLVVIAVMGVLSGVAVIGVGRFREKAQEVSLDQSLEALATAVNAHMILNNISDLTAINPADLDIKNTDGIDFVSVAPTPDSVTVQARFAGTDEPCRQIHFPDSAPGPCTSVTGPSFPFKPGVEVALGDESGSGGSPGSNEAKPEELKPENPATDGGDSAQKGLTITGADSKFLTWTWSTSSAKGRKPNGDKLSTGAGEWVAAFGFANSWKHDQKLVVTGIRHESSGDGVDRPTKFEQELKVPAGGSATLEVVENHFKVTVNGKREMVRDAGVSYVELIHARVETLREDGRQMTFEMDTMSSAIKRPSEIPERDIRG